MYPPVVTPGCGPTMSHTTRNTVIYNAGKLSTNTGQAPVSLRYFISNQNPGKVDAEIFGAGAGDEVWFNAGDNNYYATGSGSPYRPLPAATAQGATPLAIIDA